MKTKINLVSKKDLVISYFVGPGAGGQNKQKTSSGVNISHPASGAVGRCSESRSQEENKRAAFLNLNKHPKMKVWIAKRIWEIQNETTIEKVVQQEMEPQNLDIQVKVGGKWVSESTIQ